MTIKYDWKINRLQCLREKDGNEKIVTNVFWLVIGNLYENSIIMSGSAAITFADDNAFVPYDQLTEQTVISWIPNDMKEIVEGQILERLNSITIQDEEPDNISLPLPWSEIQ